MEETEQYNPIKKWCDNCRIMHPKEFNPNCSCNCHWENNE